jgi:hypothetical protein
MIKLNNSTEVKIDKHDLRTEVVEGGRKKAYNYKFLCINDESMILKIGEKYEADSKGWSFIMSENEKLLLEKELRLLKESSIT